MVKAKKYLSQVELHEIVLTSVFTIELLKLPQPNTILENYSEIIRATPSKIK